LNKGGRDPAKAQNLITISHKKKGFCRLLPSFTLFRKEKEKGTVSDGEKMGKKTGEGKRKGSALEEEETRATDRTAKGSSG